MRCWLCLTREPGKWMGRGSLLVCRMHTRAAAALLLRRTMPLRRRTEHLPSARYLTPRFDLAQPVKMLLLGAGESGKSTIFKQMKVRASRPTAVHRVQPHDPCSHCLQPSHACHSTGRQPGAGVGEGEIGIVRPRTRPVGRWERWNSVEADTIGIRMPFPCVDARRSSTKMASRRQSGKNLFPSCTQT
jgi:hypothetical protein